MSGRSPSPRCHLNYNDTRADFGPPRPEAFSPSRTRSSYEHGSPYSSRGSNVQSPYQYPDHDPAQNMFGRQSPGPARQPIRQDSWRANQSAGGRPARRREEGFPFATPTRHSPRIFDQSGLSTFDLTGKYSSPGSPRQQSPYATPPRQDRRSRISGEFTGSPRPHSSPMRSGEVHSSDFEPFGPSDFSSTGGSPCSYSEPVHVSTPMRTPEPIFDSPSIIKETSCYSDGNTKKSMTKKTTKCPNNETVETSVIEESSPCPMTCDFGEMDPSGVSGTGSSGLQSGYHYPDYDSNVGVFGRETPRTSLPSKSWEHQRTLPGATAPVRMRSPTFDDRGVRYTQGHGSLPKPHLSPMRFGESPNAYSVHSSDFESFSSGEFSGPGQCSQPQPPPSPCPASPSVIMETSCFSDGSTKKSTTKKTTKSPTSETVETSVYEEGGSPEKDSSEMERCFVEHRHQEFCEMQRSILKEKQEQSRKDFECFIQNQLAENPNDCKLAELYQVQRQNLSQTFVTEAEQLEQYLEDRRPGGPGSSQIFESSEEESEGGGGLGGIFGGGMAGRHVSACPSPPNNATCNLNRPAPNATCNVNRPAPNVTCNVNRPAPDPCARTPPPAKRVVQRTTSRNEQQTVDTTTVIEKKEDPLGAAMAQEFSDAINDLIMRQLDTMRAVTKAQKDEIGKSCGRPNPRVCAQHAEVTEEINRTFTGEINELITALMQMYEEEMEGNNGQLIKIEECESRGPCGVTTERTETMEESPGQKERVPLPPESASIGEFVMALLHNHFLDVMQMNEILEAECGGENAGAHANIEIMDLQLKVKEEIRLIIEIFKTQYRENLTDSSTAYSKKVEKCTSEGSMHKKETTTTNVRHANEAEIENLTKCLTNMALKHRSQRKAFVCRQNEETRCRGESTDLNAKHQAELASFDSSQVHEVQAIEQQIHSLKESMTDACFAQRTEVMAHSSPCGGEQNFNSDATFGNLSRVRQPTPSPLRNRMEPQYHSLEMSPVGYHSDNPQTPDRRGVDFNISQTSPPRFPQSPYSPIHQTSPPRMPQSPYSPISQTSPPRMPQSPYSPISQTSPPRMPQSPYSPISQTSPPRYPQSPYSPISQTSPPRYPQSPYSPISQTSPPRFSQSPYSPISQTSPPRSMAHSGSRGSRSQNISQTSPPGSGFGSSYGHSDETSFGGDEMHCCGLNPYDTSNLSSPPKTKKTTKTVTTHGPGYDSFTRTSETSLIESCPPKTPPCPPKPPTCPPKPPPCPRKPPACPRKPPSCPPKPSPCGQKPPSCGPPCTCCSCNDPVSPLDRELNDLEQSEQDELKRSLKRWQKSRRDVLSSMSN